MPSLPLTDPRLHWSSRWVFAPDSQKAVAHWAGATLRFFVRGTHVYIGTGDSERLDQYNGNLPMTMTRVSNTQTREHVEKFCELLEPTAIISAVDDEDLQYHGKDAVLCVELVLSDWASRLEVVSIVVDDLDCLLQLHSEGPRRNVRALFIGDSITCGFVDFASDPDDSDDETSPLPRGCWDAYPYVTENLMRTRFGIADFETEISAYPGATLVVAPPRDEDDGEEEDVSEEVGPFDTNCALSKKFFHESPLPYHEELARLERCAPHIIVIALGTNDEDLDIKPVLFDDTLKGFIINLAGSFKDTLAHVVILRPFPYFRTYTHPDWPTLESRDLSGVVASSRELLQDTLGVSVRFHVWNITDQGYYDSHTLDGTHPTVEGHKVLGKNLAEMLDSALGANCDRDCKLCSQLQPGLSTDNTS